VAVLVLFDLTVSFESTSKFRPVAVSPNRPTFEAPYTEPPAIDTHTVET
jgi:hypothetical protein